jgi:DNA-binding MarR family transcriptional regulator
MTALNKTSRLKGRHNVSLEQKTLFDIVRTSECLVSSVNRILNPHGLTFTQYNVLRILLKAGAAGLTCSEVGSLMMTRDADVTRLLSRLEKKGLAIRNKDAEDRRVIRTKLSPDGLDLLKELERSVSRWEEESLVEFGEDQLKSLIILLELVRYRQNF